MTKFLTYISIAIVGATLITSCAPQAQYFNVDVKSNTGTDIPINNGKAAVFAITPAIARDSIRTSGVALGLAEKLEKDREFQTGDIAVFSIPQTEFKGIEKTDNKELNEYNKEYLRNLMLKSGADIQILISKLAIYNYSLNKLTPNFGEGLVTSITLPYSVSINVYNALEDSLLYSNTKRDSIYLQLTDFIDNRESINKLLVAYLPEVTKKIGEGLASHLTIQWETQERMLITFEGEDKWAKPYELAQDFKWQEAIDLWMPLTQTQNPRKAAYAAYNIALACEMLEQFPLAMEWTNFALKKFQFREAIDLKKHLIEVKKR